MIQTNVSRSDLENISLLVWLSKNCAKVDYVLVVNDLTYVNVHNFGHFIRTMEVTHPSIFGFAFTNAYVTRGKRNFLESLNCISLMGDSSNIFRWVVFSLDIRKLAVEYVSSIYDD